MIVPTLYLRGSVSGIALCLGIVGLIVGSPTVILGSGLVGLVGPPQIDRIEVRRRRERALRELPNLIDLLLVDIRSGAGLRDALLKLDNGVELHEARQLLAPLTRSLNAGLPVNQSIGTFAASSEPSLRLIGVGLQVLATTGGPMAQPLQHLRHTLMASVHARQEIHVQASQARASASVLSLAPLIFAALAAIADPRVANFYLFQWQGALCVVSSVLLTVLGWRWMISLADNCEDGS